MFLIFQEFFFCTLNAPFYSILFLIHESNMFSYPFADTNDSSFTNFSNSCIVCFLECFFLPICFSLYLPFIVFPQILLFLAVHLF